jgi:hypothetical protein
LSGEGPCLDNFLTVEFSAENTKIGPILLTSILLPAGQLRNRLARTQSPFEFSAEKTWRPAGGATETRVVTLAGRQEFSAENSQGGLNKIWDRPISILRQQKLLRTPRRPVVWMQKSSGEKLQIFALHAVPDKKQLIRVREMAHRSKDFSVE